MRIANKIISVWISNRVGLEEGSTNTINRMSGT